MTYRTLMETLGRICIPQRYILGIMGFLGIANAYIMRACLSIAITKMVKTPNNGGGNSPSDLYSCPWPEDTQTNTTTPIGTGQYDWDAETQGFILSAFYYGYILTHIPGGLLAERFGGKHMMGFGIFSTALFTLITPFVADQGVTAMFVLRVLMGIGEGTTFPALSTLLAQWAPPLERSKLAALVFAGVQIGTVISVSVSGLILNYMEWPNVFYIFGTVGIIWFIVWCAICFNDPNSHPFITDKEKEYLKETIGVTERNSDLQGTPWGEILSSGSVWALTIAEIGHDFALYMMVTDLPKYMNDVMHFKIAENGALSALPYLVMWFTSLTLGYLADFLLEKQIMELTSMRKTLATIGAVGPAIGCILASYAGCNKPAVVTLFTVGMGFMGFCYASLRVNGLDISPNYAGTLMAIANGMGSVSGMVAPYLVGLFTPNSTLKEWRQIFWLMAIILIGSNFVFIFFGSAEVANWNEPKLEEEKSKEEERRRRKSSTMGEKRAKYSEFQGIPLSNGNTTYNNI